MLTRRGAFRQRGMDLPKIQTDIGLGESTTSPTCDIDMDMDADLESFTRVDYSCLDFLTPTSRRSSNTNSTTTGTTPEAGSSAGVGDEDDNVPWPRPMDRDIHGRSELKRTAPQWAIRVRWVLSRDFEQESPARQGWDDGTATQWQRRPSVVDRRYSYGRKIQGGRGRRPPDFSLRSGPPPGLVVHYENIPLELALCSEEDSLYSN